MPSLQRNLTLNIRSKIRSPLLKKSKKSRTEGELFKHKKVSVGHVDTSKKDKKISVGHVERTKKDGEVPSCNTQSSLHVPGKCEK